jgi:hypothetical protein
MNQQNDELAAVKRKIRALTAKTVEAGATEAEAMQAMAKVDEFLRVFNLSLNDVLIGQESYVTKVVDLKSKHSGIAGDVSVRVAQFTETKVWINRHHSGVKLSFFGTESDTDMAVYLIEMLQSAFNRAYAEFKNSDVYKNHGGHRRSLHANFLRGFSRRINFRLNELTEERKDTERKTAAYHAEQMKDAMIEMAPETEIKVAQATTGTALISIEKEKRLETEFDKLGMKLRSVSVNVSNYRYNTGANSAGGLAGSSVNFGRPVNSRASGVAGYLK